MGIHWTQSELQAAVTKIGKPTKYHAKRVQVDGIWFDSKREAARFGELKLMKQAGILDTLEIHPRFAIPPDETGDYDDWPHICNVELDFYYWDLKRLVGIYEDVKGKDNALSALKRKLVEAFYGIKVEIIK